MPTPANPETVTLIGPSLDPDPQMNEPRLSVLYEDNHLLAVFKPPGIATQGARPGETSLWDLAREDLKQRYGKPGNVYLGVVSRLDKPVSGVVLFARTSKAAARLNDQFRQHSVTKVYWAIILGKMVPDEGELEDWLAPAEGFGTQVVSFSGGPDCQSTDTPCSDTDREGGSAIQTIEDRDGAEKSTHSSCSGEIKRALLRYQTKSKVGKYSLIKVYPETGRKHQIRVQFASRGHPIVGDTRYGSTRSFGRTPHQTIALHARSLTVEHPTRREPLTIQAEPPRAWQVFPFFQPSQLLD